MGDGKRLTALFCGAHGRANGLDAVLDVAAELLRRGRDDIRLQFVGDGQLKPDLVARAQQEGLLNCEFLDPVPKEELPQLLAASDVGLMILADVPAFQFGTSPNKFFDYIAAGKAVVCNYPGWIADLLEANACGLSVPPGDTAAFADALEQLADQPEKCIAMGEQSLVLARSQFDRDLLYQRLNELLKEKE